MAGREQLLAALTDIISGSGAPSMLMATHHLEEIPVGFTHALALRAGTRMAAGPLDEVLTNPAMSAVFGLPLEITLDRGRYTARGSSAGSTARHLA